LVIKVSSFKELVNRQIVAAQVEADATPPVDERGWIGR
jgi:hypothetical protein